MGNAVGKWGNEKSQRKAEFMQGWGMLGKCSHEVIVYSWALRHGRTAVPANRSTRAGAPLSRLASLLPV